MTNGKNALISILVALHLTGQRLFLPVLAALDPSSYAFPNGQQATGYEVCNPTAAQSSCCLEGEACLQNGLCYGAIEFMYRGALGLCLKSCYGLTAADSFEKQWLGEFYCLPGLLQHCRRYVIGSPLRADMLKEQLFEARI